MIAYGQAVVLLGVSRAVLFPAVVPALSVIVGIPIVGEIPSLLQIAGLILVTAGLLTTIGLFRRSPNNWSKTLVEHARADSPASQKIVSNTWAISRQIAQQSPRRGFQDTTRRFPERRCCIKQTTIQLEL